MSDSARSVQQRAILQALILRGKLPTQLRVRFGASGPRIALCTTLLGLLAAAAPNISLLELQFSGRSADSIECGHSWPEDTSDSEWDSEADQDSEPAVQQEAGSSALYGWAGWAEVPKHEAPDPLQATALLHTAAAALPRLSSLSLQWWPLELPPTLQWPQITSLELDGCECSLLPPSHLPGLRELAVNRSDIGLSLPPYITQVTALHLCEDQWENHWDTLFSPATTSHTLTTLRVSSELTGRLLGLLLLYAPQLSVLSVECVSVETDKHRGAQWGLRQLNIEHPTMLREQAMCLARLPSSTAGPLRVHIKNLNLPISSVQGLDPPIAQRFPDFVFNCDTIQVHPNRMNREQLPPDSAPTAWGNTLQQLRQLQAPTATVQLESALLGSSTAAVLAAELPALKHLRVCLMVVYQLTDDHMAAVLQLGAHVRALASHSLQLRPEQHSSAAWPWDELRLGNKTVVDRVNVTHLLRLPHPGSRATPPLLRCTALSVYESVAKAGVERVRDWLRHVRFSGERTCFTLYATSTHQPDALRAQCYVLQAVRFHSAAAEHSATVQLHGWDMTRPALAALQGLPQWACSLVFDQCTWPLRYVEYRHMALHVPTSYTAWRVGDRYRECSSGADTDSDSDAGDEGNASEGAGQQQAPAVAAAAPAAAGAQPQAPAAAFAAGPAPAVAQPQAAAAAPLAAGVQQQAAAVAPVAAVAQPQAAGAAAVPAPAPAGFPPWTQAMVLALEASKERFDEGVRHKFVMQPGALLESVEEGVCEYRAQLGLLPVSVECADCLWVGAGIAYSA